MLEKSVDASVDSSVACRNYTSAGLDLSWFSCRLSTNSAFNSENPTGTTGGVLDRGLNHAPWARLPPELAAYLGLRLPPRLAAKTGVWIPLWSWLWSWSSSWEFKLETSGVIQTWGHWSINRIVLGPIISRRCPDRFIRRRKTCHPRWIGWYRYRCTC